MQLSQRPVRRPSCRWKDNIKVDDMNWIKVCQNNARWQDFVNMVMKLHVQKRRIILSNLFVEWRPWTMDFVKCCGLDGRVLGFDSRRRLVIFLFTTASRPALGPTQPPIQWVAGALSLGLKRPGREADHSPPSSAEVKNAWSYTSTPPNTPSWRGAQLKYRSRGTTLRLPYLIYFMLFLLNETLA
jgi:hypothetical protein